MNDYAELKKQEAILSGIETRLEHDLEQIRELIEDIDLKLSEYGSQEEDDVVL